ncbi:uncharacterized protein LOC6561957 [Drosophila grimshawi]|uniref:GH11283 n=1 Tax=Drosophila grimshawi TaxID=7222 RepID=B4JE04_DROGR|nr:uncharacterized protein LOC6561957 [Drosophila grimshawi]EDW03524.1 GH11283 [Drosophila grimshawi]
MELNSEAPVEQKKEITSLDDANKKPPDNKNELEDELEDGEIYDSDYSNPEKAPICPFYRRNICTWGSSCRYRHLGCMNMGNYVMFDNVNPLVLPTPPSRVVENSNPVNHKTEIERSFNTSLQEHRQMMRDSGYNLSKPKPRRRSRKPWLKVEVRDTHRSERLDKRLPKLHGSTPYRPYQLSPKAPDRIVTVCRRRSSSSSSSTTTDDYTSTTNSSSSSGASHPQGSKASRTPLNSARPSRMKNVQRAPRKARYLSSSSDSSSDTSCDFSTHSSELRSSDSYNPRRYSRGRYKSRSRSTCNNNYQKKGSDSDLTTHT